MQAMILLALCLGLAVTSQAHPYPCRSPPFMQGHAVVVYPNADYYAMEEFFYDGEGQRENRRAIETEHNQTIYREDLFLFQKGVYYEIYRHNKTCTKSPLKSPWIPIEVPKDSSFQREVVIGSLSAFGEGLVVNNWMGKLPQFKADYFMTFTQWGCLPVSITFNVENEGYVFRDFYDLVVGVEDPEIFIPPDYCEKASDRGGEVRGLIDTLVKK